jgi:regulatory protein
MTDDPALAIAYAYLNRRERTESELRAHLETREQTDDGVQAAIEELTELGYLDDARYARLFTQDKRNLEQWGAERIRRALNERGVDRDLVEQALRAEEPELELDRALALLRARFPRPPADRRDRDRALGMMIRKGYDSELALDALSAYARE